MDITPSFMFGDVTHARLFPAKNTFSYRIYYLTFDLTTLYSMSKPWLFGVNKPSLMTFYERDHGARDGSPLIFWIRHILALHNLQNIDGPVVLMTMPRIFGYVFNPVSFWLCYDKNKKLGAVLCEVNNTFGETHSYLCHLPDSQIENNSWIESQKVFHVSPFLPREGAYKFRFNADFEKISIQIDYFDSAGNKQLITIVNGKLEPFTYKSWRKAFFGYPLITFRAVYLIHWQAIKLWFKRQKYFSKPIQLSKKIT